MIKVIPNKKDIGAEIICDLRKVSKEDLRKLKSALYKYGVIFFKNQNLTSGTYLKFAKNFGKLANYPRLKGLSKKLFYFCCFSISKLPLKLTFAFTCL